MGRENILDTFLDKGHPFLDLAMVLLVATGASVPVWLPLKRFAPLDAGPVLYRKQHNRREVAEKQKLRERSRYGYKEQPGTVAADWSVCSVVSDTVAADWSVCSVGSDTVAADWLVCSVVFVQQASSASGLTQRWTLAARIPVMATSRWMTS